MERWGDRRRDGLSRDDVKEGEKKSSDEVGERTRVGMSRD